MTAPNETEGEKRRKPGKPKYPGTVRSENLERFIIKE
jgi:hypothetical protein